MLAREGGLKLNKEISWTVHVYYKNRTPLTNFDSLLKKCLPRNRSCRLKRRKSSKKRNRKRYMYRPVSLKIKKCQLTKLKELVVSGELPCTKEESATLAGIQLHIEEAWPEEDSTSQTPGQNNLPKSPNVDKSKKEDEHEWRENLRKKKELIKLNRAQRITSTRRKGKLVRQLMCASDNELECLEDCDLARFLPPEYTTSKKVRELIKEKKKTLWHTSYYENELKLKQLYVKICKNLPSYGSKIFQVKEVLRGNTQKKVPRLLAVSCDKIVLLDSKTKAIAKSQNIRDLEDWLTGSGKTHDGLVLEFRGNKPWTLNMATIENLKSVTAAIWEALDLDGRFLNNGTLHRDSLEFDFQCRQFTLRPELNTFSKYSAELEQLQKMLHFPEEVALLMTKTEHELFMSVSPAQYVRHITVDLTRSSDSRTGLCVEDLIQRFNEVSTWITQTIITQATHEDRKAVLSCILRLAVYCWVLGNFNSAVEILAGLKSEKLKPFWLSIGDEDVSLLHSLSDVLLTREPSPVYREAVARALDIPYCQVVPFFGGFLRDLKAIFMGVPSIIVLPSEENQSLEFVSDYNGEDRFMTRIGVGGLINMDKLRQTHIVLNDLHLFHHHAENQKKLISTDKDKEQLNSPINDEDTADSDYELELDGYEPIRPLNSEHEVMIITPKLSKLNHHWLQCMNHGSTAIQWEEDSGRSCICFLKLEIDNATLTWRKPAWSALKGTGQDYSLRGDDDSISTSLLAARYSNGEDICDNLEEGYLDVRCIKDILIGDDTVDLGSISKRHGLENLTHKANGITILYGAYMAENRKLHFIAPEHTANIWCKGLNSLVATAKRLQVRSVFFFVTL
ncbi:hypothetical protein SNE40_008387 [Patella caerulea]|uniref:Ras-GEF domain-containing protein n=1 Tax=Patella caerulea TaxID=87958 RepID=A0AAN8K822_PATCE